MAMLQGSATQATPRGAMYCTQCGTIDKPKTETKGSLAIEIILWLLMILPGVIYTVWRLTTRGPVCRTCGAKEIIPPDSPRAKQLRAV
jgi:hypothetical protein